MNIEACHIIAFQFDSRWVVGYVDQGKEIVPFDGSFPYMKMAALKKEPIVLGSLESFSGVNDVVYCLRQEHPEIEAQIKIDFLPFVKAQKKCKHITDRKMRNNTIEDPWDIS